MLVLLIGIRRSLVQTRDVICLPLYGDFSVCQIDEDVFDGTEKLNIISTQYPEEVHEFNFEHGTVEVTAIPTEFFEKFPNITYVSLTQRSLTKLKRGDFSKAVNVEVMSLFINQISEIEDFVFYNMPILSRLHLGSNSLTVVRRYMFEGLINLKHLNLGDNDIGTIEEGAFNLPSLINLEVDGNNLKSLPAYVFAGIPQLQILSVQRNNLTRIANVFEHLKDLEQLYLDENPIEDLTLEQIVRVSKLRVLFLAQIGFKFPSNAEVEDAAMAWSQLEKLDLSGNELSNGDILMQLARVFRQMKWLRVHDNNFTTIDRASDVKTLFPHIYYYRLI